MASMLEAELQALSLNISIYVRNEATTGVKKDERQDNVVYISPESDVAKFSCSLMIGCLGPIALVFVYFFVAKHWWVLLLAALVFLLFMAIESMRKKDKFETAYFPLISMEEGDMVRYHPENLLFHKNQIVSCEIFEFRVVPGGSPYASYLVCKVQNHDGIHPIAISDGYTEETLDQVRAKLLGEQRQTKS